MEGKREQEKKKKRMEEIEKMNVKQQWWRWFADKTYTTHVRQKLSRLGDSPG